MKLIKDAYEAKMGKKLIHIKIDNLGRRTDRVKRREIEQMLRLHTQGLTDEEIAKKLHRKPQTVRRHLSRAKTPLKRIPILIIEPILNLQDFNPKEGLRRRYFSHFDIMNNGNAPAVTISIRLVDINNKDLGFLVLTLLKAGERIGYNPFTPDVDINKEGSKFYLVCDYSPADASNSSRTVLPFDISPADEPGKLYITPGELISDT